MTKHEPQDQSLVIVIDDDEGLRESLGMLFRSAGMQVRLLGSAREFFQAAMPDVPCCLVLDVRLPGISGLDFQSELHKAGIYVPIVFITGHGDIPMTVQAMKAGAVEFLTKPLRELDLLDAVRTAIKRDFQRRVADRSIETIKNAFHSLTPRERQVIALVANGLMNKQIAANLGLSEITVKVHRGSVMRKMGARSLAELVKMSEALRLTS
jgi:FixJ family two-component response regulator